MNRYGVFAICFVLWTIPALAQNSIASKFELGAEFTTTTRESFSADRAEMGFGGRFTFNFNRYVALEGAGYFFPRDCFDCTGRGRATQAVGGVKAGKRFRSWGLFAKARPGVVSFSKGQFNLTPIGGGGAQVHVSRLTSFATDVGGVLEFYPSKRIVTRFDAGDTMIFYRRRTFTDIAFDPVGNNVIFLPRVSPGRTAHNFQFSASVAFRF